MFVESLDYYFCSYVKGNYVSVTSSTNKSMGLMAGIRRGPIYAWYLHRQVWRAGVVGTVQFRSTPPCALADAAKPDVITAITAGTIQRYNVRAGMYGKTITF